MNSVLAEERIIAEYDVPRALALACTEPSKHMHTLGLKSGRLIDFTSATLNGSWATLTGVTGAVMPVEVRISEIEWCR